MCGIAGLINWGDPGVLTRMTDMQFHRGPDDGGTWNAVQSDGGWVGLGSRRLSILDLSRAGQMPMATEDGSIRIVHNGEIYNHWQLRNELEGKGYTFRSNTDTETILNLYREYGGDCVLRLNGMFAFAIWDSRDQTLFLARDHFGIKPFYYAQKQGKLAFASEAKALLELEDLNASINLPALHQYLTFLWVPEPETLFEGIRKLPAGHCAIFRKGELEVKQFWNLSFPVAGHDYCRNEEELTNELRRRFVKTVQSQMISDVPLGSFLSAGIDSSSIVAAMSSVTSEPVRTFTISFPPRSVRGELTLDDTQVARRTAEQFGCIHTDIVVEPNVADLLPKLVWHMDDPVGDPAIIMAYLVNHAAKPSVTVLLSGVGGDEIFAGYRKHAAHRLAENYQRLPTFLRRSLIEPLAEAAPSLQGTRLQGYMRLAKKMARSGSLNPRERFLMDSVYLTEEHKRELYLAEPPSGVIRDDPRSCHFAHYEDVGEADVVNQMLYVDIKTFMVSLNLNYNDKMSMASSVEVRVPFLDWELAEWVAQSVPPNAKLRDGTTKHILREAMRPILPSEVLGQKKAGFGAPTAHWLRHDLREMVDDLLSETNIRRRNLFVPREVRRLVEEQRDGRRDWSMQVWQFLTLELWMRAFLD